jgi:hypothetical protein
MVFQEYAKQSVSTPIASLNACVVGPCYHIMDPTEDEVLSYAGEIGVAGVEDVMLPNNYPGAKVVEESVNVRFKDVQVSLKATPFVGASTKDNQIIFADAASFPADVMVGDKVTAFTQSDASVVCEDVMVVQVDEENFTLYLSNTVLQVAEPIDVTVTREVGEYTLTPEDSSITVDAGDEIFSALPQTVLVNDEPCSVVYAKMYVGYKALRQDLSDVYTVADVDEARGRLGKLVPENPLGYAVMLTLANTNTSVKLVGVDSDDVAGYTAAKDRLENVDNVYGIVPCTQESEILGIFKLHCQQMSVPEVGKWRVCIGSTELQTVKSLQEGVATISNSDDNLPIVIKDSEAQFTSNGVDAGHTLTLFTEAGGVEYVVEAVIAEDMLLVDNANPIDTDIFTLDTESYEYKISKDLDKTMQAQALQETSKSFGTSRFVHTWPDVCVIDDQELPGFYLSCAVAGMIAGLPSHQGFTRISIAGVGGLKHANDYFNATQMDIIAEGGTFVFLQDNPSAAPYVRHQLTTDMSTIEFQELSFVKNFDYVSYVCKDVMDKFLGRYNITPSTLGLLETSLKATLESLKLYTLPRIGSPVLGYDVVKVHQLDDIRDRVEMYAEVDFPYVLNTIGLHLVSR